MRLNRIKKLDVIVNSNFENEDISRFWEGLLSYNEDFDYDQTKEAFLLILKTLLDNRIIKMAGAYTDQENIWEGTNEDIIGQLDQWISSLGNWNYKNDYSFKFYFFDYPFMIWLTDEYPIDLEKYDIDYDLRDETSIDYWLKVIHLENDSTKIFQTASAVLKKRWDIIVSLVGENTRPLDNVIKEINSLIHIKKEKRLFKKKEMNLHILMNSRDDIVIKYDSKTSGTYKIQGVDNNEAISFYYSLVTGRRLIKTEGFKGGAIEEKLHWNNKSGNPQGVSCIYTPKQPNKGVVIRLELDSIDSGKTIELLFLEGINMT